MKKIRIIVILLTLSLGLVSCLDDKNGYTKELTTEGLWVGEWTLAEKTKIEDDITSKTSSLSAFTCTFNLDETVTYSFLYKNYYVDGNQYTGYSILDYYRNFTLKKESNVYTVSRKAYINLKVSFQDPAVYPDASTLYGEYKNYGTTTTTYSSLELALNAMTMDTDTSK